MIGPTWFADTLAAVLLVIAVYDLGRLAVVVGGSIRRTERDVDAYHVAMGVSMAGMLTGSLTNFERQAWAVVFGFTTVWFALRLPWNDALRAAEPQPVGHRVAHVLSSGAMAYMMLAVSSSSMAAMAAGAAGTGARLPGLAALLAVMLLVATAVDADRLLLRPLRGVTAAAPASAVAVTAPVGPDAATTLATEPSVGRSAVRPTIEASASVADDGAPSSDRFLAPRLAAATEVVMGLAMVIMLVALARS
jgi:hypothetical protein